MMRCVKSREGRGRSDLQRRLALYNEAIWWHKSVVSEVFLQASLFISYICKVPENIPVTLNPNTTGGLLFIYSFFFLAALGVLKNRARSKITVKHHLSH